MDTRTFPFQYREWDALHGGKRMTWHFIRNDTIDSYTRIELD